MPNVWRPHGVKLMVTVTATGAKTFTTLIVVDSRHAAFCHFPFYPCKNDSAQKAAIQRNVVIPNFL